MRTRIALTIAGLAAGSTMLLAGGAANAATSSDDEEGMRANCRYKVTAHSLNVHKHPSIDSRVIGKLHKGQKIWASCWSEKGKVRFWKKIAENGVPHKLVGGWVDREYLKRVKPHGGVDTGAGGAAADMSGPVAAGLGAIALGGGLAIAARRRKVIENS